MVGEGCILAVVVKRAPQQVVMLILIANPKLHATISRRARKAPPSSTTETKPHCTELGVYALDGPPPVHKLRFNRNLPSDVPADNVHRSPSVRSATGKFFESGA